MRLPGNVNFSFKGVEGGALLILLEEDGICASGGSACNTGESRISYVIEELGVPMEYAPGTIRFSMCGDTTKAEVDAAIAILNSLPFENIKFVIRELNGLILFNSYNIDNFRCSLRSMAETPDNFRVRTAIEQVESFERKYLF